MSVVTIDRPGASRRAVLAGLAASALASPASAGHAYPDHPLTFIIPWAEGGGSDTAGRLLASLLERELGKQVLVMNRTGETGLVGHQAIATADPDGYTIGFATTEIAIFPLLGKTDLNAHDLTPIGLVNEVPAAVLVAASSPWATLADAIGAIRTEPGRYVASGSAIGRIWHLAFAGLLMRAQLAPDAAAWAPSDGAPPALERLASGEVHLVSCPLLEAREGLKTGKFRALAVMSSSRRMRYPKIPTVGEAIGLDWTAASFQAVVGPGALPIPVVATLERALRRSVAAPAWLGFMADRAIDPVFLDSAALGVYIDALQAKLAPVAHALKLASR